MSRPVLRTPLFATMLGIEYPIVLADGAVAGGIAGPVATAALVAAVSNAGGLGVLGGAGSARSVFVRRSTPYGG